MTDTIVTAAGDSAVLPDDFVWTPAWRVCELIANRDVSPVDVLELFLARIERLEPTLNAFAYLDAEGARNAAREAERAFDAGDPIGPLHGLPVAIMDGIKVKGMPTPIGVGRSPATTISPLSACERQVPSSSARRTPTFSIPTSGPGTHGTSSATPATPVGATARQWQRRWYPSQLEWTAPVRPGFPPPGQGLLG